LTHKDASVRIPVGGVVVEGELNVPDFARGVVLFAHGSGSSRFSPRNQYVAKVFNEQKIATLLFDLLTNEEDQQDAETGEFRFNIDLLAERLVGVTEWLKRDPQTKNCLFGYFGASTGAAAALIAAAKLPGEIAAVVSRGGRPDLAASYLARVEAPTLLLVGGLDSEVIELNRWAMEQMSAEKQLVIVPGATHLFEEPGKLEEVAKLSTEWFLRYLK
jgi:pimeloyl-ACP methyl ester carboxylesterase